MSTARRSLAPLLSSAAYPHATLWVTLLLLRLNFVAAWCAWWHACLWFVDKTNVNLEFKRNQKIKLPCWSLKSCVESSDLEYNNGTANTMQLQTTHERSWCRHRHLVTQTLNQGYQIRHVCMSTYRRTATAWDWTTSFDLRASLLHSSRLLPALPCVCNFPSLSWVQDIYHTDTWGPTYLFSTTNSQNSVWRGVAVCPHFENTQRIYFHTIYI